MPKRPVSVTLDVDNLLWLKGRTASGKRRSLSDTIDAVLTAARTGAHGDVSSRSVVGTVDIAADDPSLEQADEYVRKELEASLARGLTVHDSHAADAPSHPSAKLRKSPRGRKRG